MAGYEACGSCRYPLKGNGEDPDAFIFTRASRKDRVIMEKVENMTRSVVWRIIGTIITLAAFLIGSLIYVGFYTVGYSLGQRIVVVLVALIIAIAAISIMWVSFAGRRGWIPGKW